MIVERQRASGKRKKKEKKKKKGTLKSYSTFFGCIVHDYAQIERFAKLDALTTLSFYTDFRGCLFFLQAPTFSAKTGVR